MLSIPLRPARQYLVLVLTLVSLAWILFISLPLDDIDLEPTKMTFPSSTPSITSSRSVPENFTDHIFATKHEIPLYLRIYPAPPSSPLPIPGSPRPWLLWIHGGAYCSGQHYQLRNWIIPLFHARGYHVISNAYRFVPYVEMEDIMQDCQDALTWCRDHLLEILGGRPRGINVDNWILGGDSAGGGLATLLVHRLPIHQRPKAVVNLYGVTDLITQQQKHENEAIPPNWSGLVSEEEMLKFYKDTDPSHAVTASLNAWNLDFLPPDVASGDHTKIYEELRKVWRISDDHEWKADERVERQWDVKNYIRDKQEMVSLSLRLKDLSEEEKEGKMKGYSSVYLLDEEKTYPPTVLLHGTGDNAVPVQESYNMAKKLKDMGVEVLELYPEGMDHGWDNVYTRPGDADWYDYIEPIGKFVNKHIVSDST